MIIMQDFRYLLPEIALFAGAVTVLLTGLWVPAAYRRLNRALVLSTILVSLLLLWSGPKAAYIGCDGHLSFDNLAQGLKIAMLGLLALLCLYSGHYARDRGLSQGEPYALTLLSVLGMCFLVSAQSLLMLYLGLEMMSLPLYALIAMRPDQADAPEAGLKYFITSGLASGIFLYGASLVFGVTQSIFLPEIIQTWSTSPHWAAAFGSFFMLIGVLFKWGAVPLHMWLPDVYAGASTEVTALIATVAKIAAFGMAYRILVMMPPAATYWPQILWWVGLGSIVLGNMAALAQTQIKRLLAYSAIAQIGFVLLALGNDYQAALYYSLIYTFSVLAVFGVLFLISRIGWEVEGYEDLKGLGQHHPILALVLMSGVLSLAGIPPTAGFYAKFVVLQGLFENGDWIGPLVALLLSVVGVYYYLRLVWMMYFEAATQPFLGTRQSMATGILAIHGLLIWVMGLLPALLYALVAGMLL